MNGETARRRGAAAILFLIALAPLLATPVLPLIDFYNHLARFYVLAHIGGDPLLQKYYQAHWSLLPDIGVDVLATPILRVLPPLIAAKVIIAGILALLYSGVLYFHRALTGQRSLLIAVLLLPLLYNYILNWGFANFLLGLGLTFWGAGWWLTYRDRPLFIVPSSCVWAVAIFFSHGLTFALYGIVLVSLEVGLFLAAPSRRPYDLVRALSLVAIQAIIPVVFFASWELGRVSEAPVIGAAALAHRVVVHNGLHRLSTILRVEEGPAYWFDSATFFIQVFAVCFLIWRGKVAISRSAWPLLAVAVLLAIFAPSLMFGMFYISDRMPLFAGLCLLGALSFRSTVSTPQSRAVYGILIATVFVRLIAITANWNGYSHSYREFQSIAEKIPPESLTLEAMVGSGHHETNVPRCEMYGSLLITQYRQIGPLFADKDQQPILLVGRLKKAQEGLQSVVPLPDDLVEDFNPYMTAAAAAGYDYVMVCNRQLLTRPFPANFKTIAQTPHFALLRAGKP